MSAQKVDSEGTITFKTEAGNRFQIKFSGTITEEGEPVDHMFVGKAWSEKSPATTTEIKATRFFLFPPTNSSSIVKRQVHSLRLLGDPPAPPSPWYNKPAFLSFMGIMGIWGTIPFRHEMLHYAWTHGKPHLEKLGRKVGILKEQTKEELEKKVRDDIMEGRVNLSETGLNIENKAKLATLEELKGHSIEDVGQKAEVIKSVKGRVRTLIVEDLGKRHQVEIVTHNSGAAPTSGVVTWPQYIQNAYREKFNKVMGPDSWDNYVEGLVENVYAEKRAVVADEDVQRIEKRLTEIKKERLDRDKELEKKKKELGDELTGPDLTPERKAAIEEELNDAITEKVELDKQSEVERKQRETEKTAKEQEQRERDHEHAEKEKEYQERKKEAFSEHS